MSRDVVVVGSANADLVVEVPRRPAGGETLLGGDLRLLPGGKGANQAAAAARCGADTAILACVGSDANGSFVRERLTSAGVDVVGLIEVDRPTGTAVIFLTPDGENSIVVSPGANGALDIETAERCSGVWSDARVLVLSLEIPEETAFRVAVLAAGDGARVLLNAAPATRIAPEVLAICDPLVVNEHEALAVLGAGGDAAPGADSGPRAGDYEGVAVRLLSAGARSVVITLGADGAIAADGGSAGPTRVPAHRVRAIDTTGAGDAFVGAVACELARGAELVDAVRFATGVSAVSVQRMGAQASYADRSEVEAFIAAHAE
ncbi:ribokinase [Leucobacter sp. wl10]|uniref:ribokinase n=1 Tax=Leucobacter sp. wl10 TaxID=2304677 RepID=UPI000E5A79DE|nr:ribokinase [Leucobacter sp. wl10]RGE19807.1 ribokinase [Leucobacter sp. wl10]